MVATGFQIILSVAALCHFQACVSLDFKPLSIQHKDRKVCKNPMSGARRARVNVRDGARKIGVTSFN
jgi:hypothetical protein